MDNEQTIIPGDVYQSWLLKAEDLVSRRRSTTKHHKPMSFMTIAQLMERPPIALLNGLSGLGSTEVYYPKSILDLHMECIQQQHRHASSSSCQGRKNGIYELPPYTSQERSAHSYRPENSSSPTDALERLSEGDHVKDHNVYDMDSDEEFDSLLLAATTIACYYYESYILKHAIRDSPWHGHAYVMDLIRGHPIRCRHLLRMDKDLFLDLCNTFRVRNLLKDSRYVTIEEQMAIFLMTIGHNERNTMICERFQHSGETISRHFNAVLKAMSEFAISIIKPPNFDAIPVHIRFNPKYWPYFKDCIGALDGTHISASIPVENQVPFRGRKSSCTQNVLAVCSFNMQFTFVNAGWEGTANDSRVLLETIQNPQNNFPHPPPGKYYVVDGGYPVMGGYLVPYRGVRYHLKAYRDGGHPRTRWEMFNHAHSSLRNVIERCFGVLKARFPILKTMPSYPYPSQVEIVVACMAVHNFIRQRTAHDWLMDKYDNDDLILEGEESEEEENGEVNANLVDRTTGQRQMKALRSSIANAIAYANGGIPD